MVHAAPAVNDVFTKGKLPLPNAEPAVGAEVELEITGLGHGGEGVGRWRGLAVFVPGTVPGERVRARIVETKKNHCRGRLTEILRSSMDRIEPGCAHFGTCGGCQLLHMSYPEQLRWKTARVRENLRRLGGLAGVPVAPTVGMDFPWHYRNKVHLHAEWVVDRLVLGFFRRGSHTVANRDSGPLCACRLVHIDLLRLARRASQILEQLEVPLFAWPQRRGYLRNLVLRRGAVTGEMMLVLVTGREDWSAEAECVRRLTAAEPRLVSVIRNVNLSAGRGVLGPECRLLAGKPAITDRLLDLQFRIGPTSFFQVNPAQAEKLYRIAADFAGLTGRETVVDAYSGTGTIALYLASRARRVIGLEALGPAVADARENARLNQVQNVRFVQGAVEALLPGLGAGSDPVDVVILDPPRRGCAPEVLDALIRLQPSRVVYLSCDPATLARDLGYLARSGFAVRRVQPVDMFPQTGHVECVARLESSRK